MPSRKKKPETALTHLDPSGAARMVDVSAKEVTPREATARAVVSLGGAAFRALDASANRKGDALAVSRLAGIQAAKRTADWIPLCHPLLFDAVEVRLERIPRGRCVEVTATVRGAGRTGYEMEALVAAAAAALTLYDMCKAAAKGIVIGPIELVSKRGGKSGSWRRRVSGVPEGTSSPPTGQRTAASRSGPGPGGTARRSAGASSGSPSTASGSPSDSASASARTGRRSARGTKASLSHVQRTSQATSTRAKAKAPRSPST